MSGYLRKMARKKMKGGKGLMDRIAREHEDVLHDIEQLFVVRWRENAQVDDLRCHQAIEAVVIGQAPQHPDAAALAEGLRRVRQYRQDISDQVWMDALRVVAESIRRHSARLPGETNYLGFVGVFLP
jgi:hypothetical protein